VVATHFISEAVLENYRRKREKKFRIAVTLTDYEFHPSGSLPISIAIYRHRRGQKQSVVLWHPCRQNYYEWHTVHPKFSEGKDRKELLTKYGLSHGSPIILISAGSFGVTPLDEVITEFGASKMSFRSWWFAGRTLS